MRERRRGGTQEKQSRGTPRFLTRGYNLGDPPPLGGGENPGKDRPRERFYLSLGLGLGLFISI